MVIQRKDVISYMVFLIVVMFVMNLFTIFTVWRAGYERKHRIERQEQFEKFDSGPQPLPKQLQQQIDEVNHNFERDGVASIRFMSLNGEVKFLGPFPGGELGHHEARTLSNLVLQRLMRENINDRELIEGTVMVRRLRRALGGSGLENQKIHDLNPADVWKKLADWPNNERLLNDGTLGEILRFTSQVKVLQAKSSRRGTQLKLELLLDGGQVGIFKPAWYARDILIHGDVYGGKDRHFGEVASFYLSQILGYTNIPMVVGRKINLVREILPLATKQLNSTFFYDKEWDICFYGICYYCTKLDPVCADGEVMEGALVLLMKQKLRPLPNPWRRTYKKNQFSVWEKNMSYCKNLIFEGLSPVEREQFVLDVVSVSVFDFLIGNGDRHHFDLYANNSKAPAPVTDSYGHSRSIVLVDNGKSFGNHEEDYFDILAPLYQCCKIRRELYSTLKKYKGILGQSLDSVSAFDPLFPLLTPAHLSALDRRLKMILATVHVCQERNPHTQIII